MNWGKLPNSGDYGCGTTHYQGCDCHEAEWARKLSIAVKALEEIIIHGQHPIYDNNWAIYTLDIAHKALALLNGNSKFPK